MTAGIIYSVHNVLSSPKKQPRTDATVDVYLATTKHCGQSSMTNSLHSIEAAKAAKQTAK